MERHHVRARESIVLRGILRLVLLTAMLAAPLAADELAEMIARAEAGDVIDQSDLATAYFWGNGAPQDYKQAYIWFAVAAEGGYEEAAERRDKAAANLAADQLEQAKAEVAALMKRLAQQGP